MWSRGALCLRVLYVFRLCELGMEVGFWNEMVDVRCFYLCGWYWLVLCFYKTRESYYSIMAVMIIELG